MKPIEKGCLAILINAVDEYKSLIGATVLVGNYIGFEEYCVHHDIWDIYYNGEEAFCSESYLMRIDDYQEDKQLEREKELCHTD